MSVWGCCKIFLGSYEIYFGFIIEDGEVFNVRVSSDIDGGFIFIMFDIIFFMLVFIV